MNRSGPRHLVQARGIALIAVLWGIALLAIVAGAVSAAVQSEARLAGNLLGQAQARHAAEGAVHLAILALLDAGDESPERVDREWTIGRYTTRVAVQDEAGRIDLNLAPARLLDDLLQAVGADERERRHAVAAILDWRDADDLTRAHGAEDREYLAAGLAYGAKDAYFASVEELQLVLGISRELYRRLKPALTVHARRPGPDPRRASPLVRLALAGGGMADEADQAAARSGSATAEPDSAPTVRLRSATYAVHAQARSADGATAHARAIVRIRQDDQQAGYTILEWRADGEELFPGHASRTGGDAWS